MPDDGQKAEACSKLFICSIPIQKIMLVERNTITASSLAYRLVIKVVNMAVIPLSKIVGTVHNIMNHTGKDQSASFSKVLLWPSR
jgi:hypothetical protein